MIQTTNTHKYHMHTNINKQVKILLIHNTTPNPKSRVVMSHHYHCLFCLPSTKISPLFYENSEELVAGFFYMDGAIKSNHVPAAP